jgi:hypothetical protein
MSAAVNPRATIGHSCGHPTKTTYCASPTPWRRTPTGAVSAVMGQQVDGAPMAGRA